MQTNTKPPLCATCFKPVVMRRFEDDKDGYILVTWKKFDPDGKEHTCESK